jgi:hypothetical protein
MDCVREGSDCLRDVDPGCLQGRQNRRQDADYCGRHRRECERRQIDVNLIQPRQLRRLRPPQQAHRPSREEDTGGATGRSQQHGLAG